MATAIRRNAFGVLNLDGLGVLDGSKAVPTCMYVALRSLASVVNTFNITGANVENIISTFYPTKEAVIYRLQFFV